MSQRLSHLCEAVGATAAERFLSVDPEITGIAYDSRDVRAGSLFVCMPSASRDTHEFLAPVQASGAAAALVHSAEGLRAAERLGLPALLVEPRGTRFNFCLGRLCRIITGDPTARMRVLGVTGTNGKTTTAWMIRHALVNLGRRAAYLGTLGYQADGEMRILNNTTPFPAELWSLLAEAEQAGMTDFVMESSSHALYERRLAGVQYDVGIFTNLTQDHLDFHGTMEQYEAAKLLLFTEYAAASSKPFVATMNAKDPVGQKWSGELPCRTITYGPDGSELGMTARSVRVDGCDLTAGWHGESCDFSLRLGGLYNVENAGSALSGLIALGHPLAESCSALSSVPPVPGRFESVPNEHGIGVLVDYAHTPDALDLLLRSVRALSPRRILCVFGCGGDRDRSKRPRMAAVVSEQSDVTIVTSDNPRTEDPQAILNDVVVGLKPGSEHVAIIDRREAIAHAISMAEPGDVVVIAGKGHEDYQIIGRTKFPMDDRLMARDALEAVAW